MGGISLMGVTYGHADVYDVQIDKGRYFSPGEMSFARNVAFRS